MLNRYIVKETIEKVAAITDPSELTDLVAAQSSLRIEDKQRLLEMIPLKSQLAQLLDQILAEVRNLRIHGRMVIDTDLNAGLIDENQA